MGSLMRSAAAVVGSVFVGGIAAVGTVAFAARVTHSTGEDLAGVVIVIGIPVFATVVGLATRRAVERASATNED